MTVFAAVMTGKGTGAISTIQVFGDTAETVIKKIFEPVGAKPPTLRPGNVLLGTINDGSGTIDQVTIGCETANSFAINCHGNPLIVEMIMQLLAQHQAKLLTAEQLLAKLLPAKNTIELEVKLTQPKAKTIQGTKIIANQWHGLPAREDTAKMAVPRGLSKKATEWRQNINTITLDKISADAAEILKNSQTAKLIIAGCTVALVGPPNTGKSTLLNCLCGRQKAIVTDIKGTTRDYVTARCQIDSLSIELIDTAGLDEQLSENLERQSQKRSIQILKEADLVLLVLDNSQTNDQLDGNLLQKIAAKKVLTVLNKSDLAGAALHGCPGLDTGKLPEALSNTVQISAKLGTGIENLTEKIRRFSGVVDFDLRQPVCFTARQQNLLKQLKKAKSKQQAVSIITELLNGQV